MTSQGTLHVVLYSFVFLAFGLLWLHVFFRHAFPGSKFTYLSTVGLGALAFMVTLPLQSRLLSLVGSWLAEHGVSIWLSGALLALFTGLLQEALKIGVIWLGRVTSGSRISWRAAGLAAGLGFGVWEAWRLVALPLGAYSIWSPVAVLERCFAIGLHISLALITAYGLGRRQPGRFFLLAALWHGAVNFMALLYQGWVLSFWPTEIAIMVLSVAALFTASWLDKKAINTRKEAWY